MRLWDLSKEIPGTPAEGYLRGRGIRLDRWPDALRYTAAAPYFDGEDRRCTFGALLASPAVNAEPSASRAASSDDADLA